MSARLESKYNKFADVPKGIFEQFERRLEAAGCTPGLIQEFVRNPDLLSDWVREGNRIVEEYQFTPTTQVTLPDDGDIDHYGHIAILPESEWIAGRIIEQLHDGSLRIFVLLQPMQKVWEARVGGIGRSDEWFALGYGVEVRYAGDNRFDVRQRIN